MISSLAAMVHVSLRRSRAAWPIVAAAGLITLLATTLMAAGPIYAGAVSVAGLHRVLADAPVADANIQVSMRAAPTEYDAIDGVVARELSRAVGGTGGSLVRYGTSDTFSSSLLPTGPRTDLMELAFADGIDQHASIVAGSWPVTSTEPGAVVPVAIGDGVASALGLGVGDQILLTSRVRPGFRVTVRIAGIFHIADPHDPYWWDDPQVVDGLTTSERFATHGPFFVPEATFLARATPSDAEVGWRAFLDAGAIGLDDIDAIGGRVAALDGRIESGLGGRSVTVATNLPDILDDADRSLLVSRTGVLLLTAQFVVLAAYAVLLSAALLVEHRRVDTAMLRSRGAGPVRVAALTLIEGLLLTVPAAVLGPILAAILLRTLNVVGPLADIGLRIDPVITRDAFLAAGVAAFACLLALLLPALPRIRSFAALHGSLGRTETRTAGHRFGLDVALLAIAAIGLWQLRLYGAPLTRTVQGTLGVDPLLVATPAIGVLAGAVVALRIVPLLATVIERMTARRRGLVPSLGARQLARRPLRYTRAALLLMLAMSMGVFAITYTRTWSDSQRDQAAFQVGSDVRVEPGKRVTDLPVWAADRGYAALPAVTARTAVATSSIRVPRSEAPGQLVGLDAATAAGVVTARPDLLDGDLAAAFAPLAAARPTVAAVPIPAGTRSLRTRVQVIVHQLVQPGTDPDTGDLISTPVDPLLLEGLTGITTDVVVRDATGQLYRFSGDAVAFGGGEADTPIILGSPSRTDAVLAEPLTLLAIDVALGFPGGMEATAATIDLDGVDASDSAAPDGTTAWTSVPLGDARWRSTGSVTGAPHQSVASSVADDRLRVEIPADGMPSIQGVDQYGRGTTLTFASADLDHLVDGPVPVIATDAFLAATARKVGDSLPIQISGVDRALEISGAVRAFPTVDPTTPALVIDLPTLSLLRFEGSDATDPPEAWWLALQPRAESTIVATLRGASFGSASVIGRDERTRQLSSDPVALGVIGALAIGVAAAAAFAIVGFVVSASVSARERVTEFALLRALGLSSGQLSGWLSLENATLAIISLVAGSGLGLLVAWVALPFITVTRRATTAFPPVEVAIPWTTIAILEVAGIVALAVAIAGLTWSLARVGMASALRMGED